MISPIWLSFILADSSSLAIFISSRVILNNGDSGVIVGFRTNSSTLLLNAFNKSRYLSLNFLRLIKSICLGYGIRFLSIKSLLYCLVRNSISWFRMYVVAKL